jgi:hypothetical protein
VQAVNKGVLNEGLFVYCKEMTKKRHRLCGCGCGRKGGMGGRRGGKLLGQ